LDLSKREYKRDANQLNEQETKRKTGNFLAISIDIANTTITTLWFPVSLYFNMDLHHINNYISVNPIEIVFNERTEIIGWHY